MICLYSVSVSIRIIPPENPFCRLLMQGIGSSPSRSTFRSADGKVRLRRHWLAFCRLVDTAQAYKSEAHVGAAVKESGLKREDVFIGMTETLLVLCSLHDFVSQVTKCISKTHGYERTLKGVTTSLEKFGFGTYICCLFSTRTTEHV